MHEPSPLQDKSTLPISALKHDPSSVQDGPTTYGIVAPKQAPLGLRIPPHDKSLHTTRARKSEEGERLV